MQGEMPRRSLRSRRVFRAFFAHRTWLLLLLVTGAGLGAVWSYSQEKVFHGRLELASAVEGASTRVQLPDHARLWQLVYSTANLNLLTEGTEENSPSFDRVNRSIRLEPLSTQATGSSVWGLDLEIPAPNLPAARERLDRYAARIDSEFRERVLLVRRQRGMTPVAVRRTQLDQSAKKSPAIDGAIQRTAHAPETSVPSLPADSESSASIETSSDAELRGAVDSGPMGQAPLLPTKSPSKEAEELARELGVSVERLPLVLDQFEQSIDDRVTQMQQRESQIARAMDAINRAETNPLAVAFPPETEAQHPELPPLRARRQQLLGERARLTTYLKPAHPEFQALDRDLKEVESTLRESQQAILAQMRQEVSRWDGEVKGLREAIIADRERLAVVSQMIGLPATRTKSRSDARPTADPSLAMPTEPIPPLPVPGMIPAMGGDRPIGRVVVRPGVVDAEPVRPRAARNIAIGAAMGLLIYALSSVIRAGSDQRIHAVDDLEGLDVSLNVFGSIPKVRSGSPVKFSL